MSRRTHFLLECEYLGSAFHGVQVQPGWSTVGGELLSRLCRAVGLPARGLTFAARTDAGVSAAQNFATGWFVDADDQLPARLEQLPRQDDARLRVRAVWLVPRTVNARNSSASKCYHYRYAPGTPAGRLEAVSDAWSMVPALDVRAMRAASVHLLGCRDFSSFRAAGCAAKSPHKTLHRIDVTLDRDRIDLRIEGDAFLRKMVRIIAGTLAEVGAGLRPSDELVDVLAARDRRRAGLTAPAKGLRLERVALAGPDPLRRIWPAAAGLERLPTEGPPTT